MPFAKSTEARLGKRYAERDHNPVSVVEHVAGIHREMVSRAEAALGFGGVLGALTLEILGGPIELITQTFGFSDRLGASFTRPLDLALGLEPMNAVETAAPAYRLFLWAWLDHFIEIQHRCLAPPAGRSPADYRSGLLNTFGDACRSPDYRDWKRNGSPHPEFGKIPSRR